MSSGKKKVVQTNDEFDILEYEEVILSDDEEAVNINTPSCSNVRSSPEQKTSRAPVQSYSDSCTSADIQKLTDKPFQKFTRKPARPIRLFSFSDCDIIDRFSLVDPATKNLAKQLLEIVKSVNVHRPLKVEKNGTVVPNFYIMTTKRDLDDKARKIVSMKSVGIVSMVKEIVHMIKTCIYRDVDDIEIICDSPAIFLIKYINVKNLDLSMNCVYVVTSEYLLPYLCKIRAAEEQEEQSKRIACKLVNNNPKRKPKKSVIQSKRIKIEEPESQVVPNASTEVLSINGPAHKADEDVVEEILSKYFEPEAVQFFLSQMKTSGKGSNRCRWSDGDKLFALNLLRKNPTEYSILYEHFTLPSDKTIEKFLKQIQKEEIDNIKIE